MILKKYTKLIFPFILCFITSLKAQIVINEFSGANANVLPNEYGKYGDWIEFYNAGNSAVNLSKFKLSDDPLEPNKWQFPAVTIQSHGFITVFADDTNKLSYLDHWETAVKSNDLWRYKTPDNTTDTNWRNLSFSDLSWNQGKGGFGFGDGDDSTVLSNINTIYLRKRFTISDTAQLVKAIFNIDYDDGFVAFLNGVEIARSNLGIPGIRPNYDDFSTVEHEAKMYQGGTPDSFCVDFNLLRKAIRNGTNILAVEVHNLESSSSDLSAIPFFTIGVTRSNSIFPAPPAWFKASKREYLHANFKLSKTGETIVLSDSSGNVIDQKYTGSMQTDVSVGRKPDGTASWCNFSPPTPNSSNTASQCYSGFSTPPIFSITGGFYSGPRLLSLSATPANAIIRYTTDGSAPGDTSAIYVSSLSIDTTQTVKARVYTTGLVPSTIVTNTYFIDEDFHLPVFSISINPQNLWDDSTGIYVLGNNASTTYPYKGANYWQDWEKPVSVEYYDKQKNRAFQFDAGIKINGNYSRTKAQKSFEVLLDNDYGISEITYPLIPEKENIKSYAAFILRNAGTDWNVVHYRDGLMQRIMRKTYTGYLGYEPCDVFLNGRYWGVYEIRENDNHSYVENNFGLKKDAFDLLFEGRNLEVKNGSDTGFYAMYNYALAANHTDSSFYTKMNSLIDLNNYADYFIAETYYVNNDWIGDWTNNVKLWRPRAAGGKWQYILYDLDFGLGLYSSYTYDKINDLISPTDGNYQSDIFNSMIANPTFRNYFINRYADLINTIYAPLNVKKIAYQMRDSITADMPQQFARWGSSMSNWTQNIATLINFSNKRPARALNFVQSNFNLTSQVVLTLQAYPVGSGRIQISTIIPDSLPWKGTYFNGNPVTITAIPNPGYQFSYWKPNTSIALADSNQSIKLNFTNSDSVIAYFTGSAITPHITFTEINYQSSDSSDAGDWVEFYNPDSVAIDLTGWKFRDNDDAHVYTLPLGTLINANDYLVLSEDLEKFKTQFPASEHNRGEHSHKHNQGIPTQNSVYSVDNWAGPIGFGFANTGELLRLFDFKDSLHVAMTYSKLPPWPAAAAGQGYTLESVSNNTDLENGDNWFAGCPGGSPGTFFNAASALILADSITAICAGDSVILNAQSGDNFSYQWFKNALEIQNEKTFHLTVADSGSYTVKVKRLGCENISTAVKVSINPLPIAMITAELPGFICGNGSILLVADSANTQSFEWFKNDSLLNGQFNSMLQVTDSGRYRVKVTDNGCANHSSEMNVEIRPLPDASLQHDSIFEFCEGLQQQLSAPPVAGYSYQWFKNDSLIAGAEDSVFMASLSANYTFQSTFNGCNNYSKKITVLVDEAPETFVNYSDTLVLCVGEMQTLYAYSDTSYTYQWFKNDTLLAGADSASIEVSEAARYKLITQNSKCSSSKELVLQVHPSPIASILSDSSIIICAGTAYQLSVTKKLGYTYQWMKDSISIPGANAYKFDVQDSGNYYAIVRLNSCESFSNSIHVAVHILPLNLITTNDTTTFCEGNSLVLFSQQTPGYNYQWYKNGASLPGETDSALVALQSGNYTVVQRDSLCSNNSNSITVVVKPKPTATITASGATHLCLGDSVNLTTGNAVNYSYQWFKNSLLLAANNSSQLTVLDSGYYAVQITADACSAISDSLKVTQNPILNATILAADTILVCEGSSHIFAAITGQNLNYQWFNTQIAIPFANDSVYLANTVGSYSLLISDASCSSLSSEKTLLNFTPTVVSLSSFEPVCLSDSAFLLTGGTPLGGFYGGNAIDSNYFHPLNAVIGSNSINYTFIDSNQCASSATSIIEVKGMVLAPVITQIFDTLSSNFEFGNQWYFNDTLIQGATQQNYIPSQNGMYSLVVSDSILCNSITVYYNYLSLSTLKQSDSFLFTIYPNPNNGNFTLFVSNTEGKKLSLKIRNVLGQQIHFEYLESLTNLEKKITLKGIIPGVYFLSLNYGDKWIEQKLIVR